MSDSRIKQSEMKPRKKGDNYNDQDYYNKLIQQYNQLYKENQRLNEEHKILKELILDKQDYNSHSYVNNKEKLHFHPNQKKRSFYIQIIVGLLVIVLSLGFHIVYLAVTDCLMYNSGNPDCWIKSWLGISIHASFFIDLFLYLLVFLQSFLIILIIRNKFNELRFKSR